MSNAPAVPSARRAIRQSVAARLRTIVQPESTPGAGDAVFMTAAGSGVFTTRRPSLSPENVPVLLVHGRNEKVVEAGTGYSTRSVELVIAGAVLDDGQDDLDDKLDLLSAQIEAALDGYEIPQYETVSIGLKETALSETSEGGNAFGLVRLSYDVTYRLRRGVDEPAGTCPTRIFLGYAPNIGTGHEDDYTEVRKLPTDGLQPPP